MAAPRPGRVSPFRIPPEPQVLASLFALQNSVTSFPFMLSVKLTCGGVDSFPTVATASGAQGAWVQLAGNFTGAKRLHCR